MKRIFVPSRSPSDWQQLLARPDRHWKAGNSAMSMARSWEAASDRLPPEIGDLLATSSDPAFAQPKLLIALPEFTVPLPGGARATQTDVFALIRGRTGTAALAVEGKVDETFGPTVTEKRQEGAASRLEYLHELLELNPARTGSLRYQLLHRTSAAILIARDFGATSGAMIVQSFSPGRSSFDDFGAFCDALGVTGEPGQLASVGARGGVQLHLGWADGDQSFREPIPPPDAS